ncbi:MAG: beta-lactamase class [Acidobacteriota bacterium]|nr:beta-lactamase class [Acidobacteriota bacterium]
MIKIHILLLAAMISTNCFNAVSPEEPTQTISSAARASESLHAQIEKISRLAQGRVGASVMIIETGEEVALNGTERFPMQSVYKWPIAMTALRQVDDGTLKLEQKALVEERELVPASMYSPLRDKYPHGGVEVSVRELLRDAIIDSDGTASDVLLRLVGGAERVNTYLRELGVTGIVVATTEKEMGGGDEVQYRNWAQPEAIVRLLRIFYEGRGLSAESRALLMQLMTETNTGPHRIKGNLPAGTIVAHKTGTSGTSNGLARATNDVGLITLPDGRHLAVAVFVSDSKATEEVREGIIAQIARAAYDWAIQTH